MEKNRIMEILSLLCALLIIIAMLVNHHIFWFAVDILVIVVCGLNGIMFLKKGGQNGKI
jgi:hypothetical protein